MRRTARWGLAIFLPAMAMLFAACAQVKQPEGGPKDTVPPKLLTAEPAEGTTGFTGQRIILHFDERIKLDRVQDRLLISPPLKVKPTVAVSGGSDVVVKLNAALAPNTTYSFNFGGSVEDLSEGNAAVGLVYAVSTGSYLDSLSIKGRVLDAFGGLPVADALVVLHAEGDTGDVRTAPPAWFARSDAQGAFAITHLPPVRMVINALVDRNANYRYDLPNEDIAFLPVSIDPRDDSLRTLRLFRPRSAKQFIVNAKVLEDRGWQLTLARPGNDIALTSLDREGGNLHWWPEWNTTKDTVVMWPSDTTLLGGQRFAAMENGVVLDTITYRPHGAMPFYAKVAVATDPIDGHFSLFASRPLASVEPKRMVMHEDTVSIAFNTSLDSLLRRTVTLTMKLDAGKSATLKLLPGAVTDLQSGTNDTTQLTLGAVDPHLLGRSQVTVQADSGMVLNGPLILQLRSSKDRVVRTVRADRLPMKVEWDRLPPGSYSLKLIEDTDEDGAWTTGSFVRRIEPERVHIMVDPVLMRAGWTVETVWKVGTGL